MAEAATRNNHRNPSMFLFPRLLPSTLSTNTLHPPVADPATAPHPNKCNTAIRPRNSNRSTTSKHPHLSAEAVEEVVDVSRRALRRCVVVSYVKRGASAVRIAVSVARTVVRGVDHSGKGAT